MVNYQNGKIYAIRSFKTDEIYIGSTTQKLCRRLQKHKVEKKRYEKGKSRYTTSFKILDYDDAYIELIENCPCNSKEELLKKEGEHIRNNKCINKINPIPWTNIMIKEYHKKYNEEHNEHLKQQKKEYYEKNKEVITQKKKEYQEKNKEHLKQKSKEYQERNKDIIKQKKKEYYEKNKEVISQKSKEKVKCPHCEKEMCKKSINRHIKNIH
jgi:hypothetical protein